MKRVLFIGMSPNQGGIETYMMNVFLNLEGKGFHFTFINTSFHKLAYQNEIIQNGGTIYNVIFNQSLFGHMFWYKQALNFFKRHHGYDVVYLNTVTINYIFWLKAAKRYGISRLIIHSHNDGIIYNSKLKKCISYIITFLNIKYLNHHKFIKLAVSNGAGNWMFHNSNFKVVKNGVNVNKFKFDLSKRKQIKNKLNIPSNYKVIITVARLEPQKNYFKIIGIFKIICEYDKNIKLVIVGNGSEKYAIMNLVRKYGLSENVIFLGVINNVNEVLNIADLMLMPSKYEGFPFSLLECQSVGVPALVSSEAVPESSNITGQVKYISLMLSNQYWAKYACNMIDVPFNLHKRWIMNDKVRHSVYNINDTVDQIRNILN